MVAHHLRLLIEKVVNKHKGSLDSQPKYIHSNAAAMSSRAKEPTLHKPALTWITGHYFRYSYGHNTTSTRGSRSIKQQKQMPTILSGASFL